MSASILIVDDEELIRWSVAQDLGKSGYKTRSADGVVDALRLIEKEIPDLILTDLRLQGESGLDLLKKVARGYPDVPIVLMTGFADVDTVVEVMREGAADFISKPLQLSALKITIKRVLETAALRTRLEGAHQKRRRRYSFESLVHESPSMQEAVETARKIAASPHGTVLILGESGVGKDRMARAIHYEGTRASEPFMEISCGSIPELLLESELFGTEKGAFTGASERKKGLFETASGGTVFLNEIGHMPMSLQVKMLRVLEDKTFKRVGGREDITVDVRIIAATNADLEKGIREGTFREDLYYRINVLMIHLLPLRERKADISPLIELLLESISSDLRREKLRLPEETRRAMLEYPWPGNVRELRNALEKMMILGETEFRPTGVGKAVSSAFSAAAPPPLVEATPFRAANGVDSSTEEAIRPLEEIEVEMIRRALKKTNNNQQKAAQVLGISRDALRRRVEKYGL
ncbi:MAG: hypothetical protein AUJ52_06150 [Elusimicrobia bacterium CG1_02_63_36]|nr:MAG: hypothetical protein AUJ52_06150 [Elusimicrobia bacterium CG1_02_63_36]PIP84868.1 MAG: DNA-binding response regulator [Elusimicrobia bacterium CG22_combo_CG10-13_8_21_14_all_63_91]PJA11715.1 MAG: DNA-binding response regulator [Elusimicrobia bacterium CG_4_10_14_0_2_um_filter_63_34]PJB23267.1 MAG: DNA-binding response regulator [Elusimicrobia bacterium CG_4_9_14_3_um_filter_62_55]